MKKTNPANRKGTGKRGSRHAPPTNAFQPGAPSANPTGRPKLTETQREAREARAAAQPSAVARLVAIINDPDSKDQDAIAAAKVILEGLEPMKLDIDMKSDVTHDVRAEVVQSPERMQRIAAVLFSAGVLPIGGASGSGGRSSVEVGEKSSEAITESK